MGKLKRDDDYEYGYDHLYKEEKPIAAEEDDEGLDDEDLDEAEPDETELEIDQDDYGDYGDDEPDDTGDIESILAVERIMREVNVKPLNLDIPEDTHGMLKREAKAESLRRHEEAARSEDDFNKVVATWNMLDQNRERRERYNEVLREEATLEYGRDSQGLIFPKWMMDMTYRQLSRGSFLDYLSDCPYEMHELTGKAYLRKIIAGMKEEHKEILFFLYLRQYSPQRLAAIRGQTDRNIRKVRDVALRKVRKKVYNELKRLSESGYAMSDIERAFFDRYEETEGKAK